MLGIYAGKFRFPKDLPNPYMIHKTTTPKNPSLFSTQQISNIISVSKLQFGFNDVVSILNLKTSKNEKLCTFIYVLHSIYIPINP